jgi:flagellin FlaB
MKLVRKGHRHTHRGIIGIESAIVLIAFVIVAAALAFVVLNMGFATTQKAKTAIIAALEEAGSSLEISGKITANADVITTLGSSFLNTTNIPLKIVSGGASANLDGNSTTIKYVSSDRNYDNIYTCGPIFLGQFRNASDAWDQAVTNGCLANADEHPITGNNGPPQTLGIIYWVINKNNNTILDIGEHVVLSVGYSFNDRPEALDFVSFEITVPKGATLTVDRTVPNITTDVVDLG